MNTGMARYQGEAAHLIARGGTRLATHGPTGTATHPAPFAEVLQLPAGDPVLAVYFPAANELITLPARCVIDLANAERLRHMAEEAKNGKTGPYPDD